MTRAEAKQIVEQFKDKTSYFDGTIKYAYMEDMLRYRMGFGRAETAVILASLKLAGAKFK